MSIRRAWALVARWLQVHDPGYAAVRRAGRAAVIMPCVFAISLKVIGNPTVALFTAFGAIAQLVLVGFAGEMRNRLEAQAGLAVTGALFITLATLICRQVWLAAITMALIAFVVIFLGVVSSVLASASTALLLAFILPVATPAPLSDLPDRLLGWGIASGAALLAVWLLWPAPARSPLRESLAVVCGAFASRLASMGESDTQGASDVTRPNDPVASLQRLFLATPWRPGGLSATDRAVLPLVDEVTWLNSVLEELETLHSTHPSPEPTGAILSAATRVLIEAADLLTSHQASSQRIEQARASLLRAIDDLETQLEDHLSGGISSSSTTRELTKIELAREFVASLEFSFRSREVGFATVMIASNVERVAAAQQRSFVERVLGHELGGSSLWTSARQRISSGLKRHSIWLHNSLRGAVGLGIAVAIADEISVEHSFWVILGTLSVLRSNALSTGQNAARAIGGTVVGFVVGAALVVLVGSNALAFWILLPPVLFVAAFAPTAVSFVVGQAGFTLFIVILFNALAPVGWRVGLVRTEDVAIGVAVSAGASLLIWPRGAAVELGAAIRAAYLAASALFMTAIMSGVDPRLAVDEPLSVADTRAAGAAQRLDDTFRNYLAERGAKPAPLAEITTLVTGVSVLQMSSDAIIDLWRRSEVPGESFREARERLEFVTASVLTWYDDFAHGFTSATSQVRTTHDLSDHEVTDAVRDELVRSDHPDLALATKIVWTADHLKVIQRLEADLARSAQASADLWSEKGILQGRTRRSGGVLAHPM